MATLVYSDVDGVDRSLALGGDPVAVGRAPECAIRSTDPRVSRMHARFYLDNGALWIEDLGSSNGIFVGPNRVQRAPVPTGEIILVGSLMIRLLPASGTLPPPMGLHGTLATWLDLERKNRAAIEDERDAFAKRVGELHQQIELMKLSPTVPPSAASGVGTTLPQVQGVVDSEAIRLRDEADARAAMLEKALKNVQEELDALREVGRRNSRQSVRNEPSHEDMAELVSLRDKVAGLERELADRPSWSSPANAEVDRLRDELHKVQGQLDEAQAAQSTSEHAHGELQREAADLRKEIDVAKRSSAAEIEIAKLEAAKAREAKMVAETQAGMQAAEKLAEADQAIKKLETQIAELKAAPIVVAAPATDQLAPLTQRAEKAEKDLAQAQIRAQGAERNLAGANAQAAKAEARAAQLEQKVKDAEEQLAAARAEVAAAKERGSQLEARLGAGDAPLQAAEARATKLTEELSLAVKEADARKGKLAEAETALAAATTAKTHAEETATEARRDADKASGQLLEAEERMHELQAKLDALATADSAVAASTKARDEAVAKAAAAEKKIGESERRATDAEQRASAADTMAKAMAKDVAEALRRAADADTRAKTVSRDLGDAQRRAAEAEALEKRAAEADARTETVRAELTAKLEAAQKDLGAKLDSVQKELGAKLDSSQRELAAERQGLLQLVDRKTALEREVTDLRAKEPALLKRAEEAENRAAEADTQIEMLQERITDLESGMAVTETASQATRDEVTAKLLTAEAKIKALTEAATKASDQVEQLRMRVAELEQQLREAADGRSVAEAGLAKARDEISDLSRRGEDAAASAADEKERLEAALARAGEAESKYTSIIARAEAADLAIGRASALQRQLDEALQKLSWLERDSASAKNKDDAATTERLATADSRAKDAEGRARDAEARARAAEDDAAGAREEIAEALARIKDAEIRAAAGASSGEALGAVEQKLQTALQKVAALQKEVDAAENVRSFAAETEREIAQFQRDLKDVRAKLTQMTLERDRLESDLKDARSDEDTTSRNLPSVKKPQVGYDPEVTAQVDLSKYEALIGKSAELQDKVARLEKEDAALRTQLADTEARLRDAMDGAAGDSDAESTRTGSQLPMALAEHVSLLEEAIDSLRSNMRAASDETAMMDSSAAVTIVSDAITAAQEHIERARGAVRAMQAAIGM